jgi:MFS family permease
LILTYSILCGVGIGLLNPAAFVAVFTSFSASRNHAIGMTFAALGLGQLIMPLIAQTVVQNLDYRGSVAVMSAISLIGLFGGKKFKRRF